MLDGEVIKDFPNQGEEDKQWLSLAPEYCKLRQQDHTKTVNLR